MNCYGLRRTLGHAAGMLGPCIPAQDRAGVICSGICDRIPQDRPFPRGRVTRGSGGAPAGLLGRPIGHKLNRGILGPFLSSSAMLRTVCRCCIRRWSCFQTEESCVEEGERQARISDPESEPLSCQKWQKSLIFLCFCAQPGCSSKYRV